MDDSLKEDKEWSLVRGDKGGHERTFTYEGEL